MNNSMPHLVLQNTLSEDKFTFLGFQPLKDLVCVLGLSLGVFAKHSLLSILCQLNDVIKFNCQKPSHKRDLK